MLLLCLGLVLLIITLAKLVLLNFLYWQSPVIEVFWFCNLAAFSISATLLFFQKYSKKIASIILIAGLPAQTIWVFTFVLYAFGYRNITRLQSIDYLFTDTNMWTMFLFGLTFLMHVLALPLAIFTVYKLGFDRKILFPTLILVYILLTFSYIFSNDYTNLNCMKHSCDVTAVVYNSYDFTYYISQILYYLAATSLTYFILDKFIRVYKK